jgi:hypothetical protein
MLSSSSRSVNGLRNQSRAGTTAATLKWVRAVVQAARRHGVYRIAHALAGAEDLAAGILQRVPQRLIQTIVVFDDQNSLAEE